MQMSTRWLRSQLKKSSHIRKWHGDIDLLRKYGSLHPTRVEMVGSDNVIFCDPREPRGKALLRNRCAGQPRLKELWMRALETLEPSVVIDVGVNYGEFIFLPTYKPETRIFGFEPIPQLRSFLEQSLEVHPSRAQIQMSYVAAGATDGPPLTIYVDPTWTGRSSALPKANLNNPTAVEVDLRTVDSVLDGAVKQDDVVVFKIDVESYEEEVLRGMTETLGHGRCAGILEFNGPMLESLGRSEREFFELLASQFSIWSVQKKHPLTRVEAIADFAEPRAETDLLLVNDDELARRLNLPAKGVVGR